MFHFSSPRRLWSRMHRLLHLDSFFGKAGLSVILAIVFFTVLAATGLMPVLMRLPARLLCVCEEPVGAYDAIIVMMGDHRARRVEVAAALYQAGVSKRIQLVQPEPGLYEEYGMVPGEATLASSLLHRLGVPEDRVIVFTGPDGMRATSSFEEAKIHLDQLLGSTGIAGDAPIPNKDRRVLLVTDWFHTSRARWIFRKVFSGSGITVDAAAARKEWVDQWWRDEGAFLGLFDEYLKWAYYLLKY